MMKYLYYVALTSVLLMSSCSKNDDVIGSKDLSLLDNPILGTWKLTEAFISAGGPQYWIDIENGEEFTFLSNGTFSSNKFSQCSDSRFSIDSNELILNYNCNGVMAENEYPEGAITYKITFESNYLLLTPTSVMCVEGCSYKYIRK